MSCNSGKTIRSAPCAAACPRQTSIGIGIAGKIAHGLVDLGERDTKRLRHGRALEQVRENQNPFFSSPNSVWFGRRAKSRRRSRTWCAHAFLDSGSRLRSTLARNERRGDGAPCRHNPLFTSPRPARGAAGTACAEAAHMKIISGNGNLPLAQAIASYVELPLTSAACAALPTRKCSSRSTRMCAARMCSSSSRPAIRPMTISWNC